MGHGDQRYKEEQPRGRRHRNEGRREASKPRYEEQREESKRTYDCREVVPMEASASKQPDLETFIANSDSHAPPDPEPVPKGIVKVLRPYEIEPSDMEEIGHHIAAKHAKEFEDLHSAWQSLLQKRKQMERDYEELENYVKKGPREEAEYWSGKYRRSDAEGVAKDNVIRELKRTIRA